MGPHRQNLHLPKKSQYVPIWYLSTKKHSLSSPAEHLRGFCTVATKVNQITLCVPTGHSGQAANLTTYLLHMIGTSQFSLMLLLSLHAKEHFHLYFLFLSSRWNQLLSYHWSEKQKKRQSGVHTQRNKLSNSVQKAVPIWKFQLHQHAWYSPHKKMCKSEENEHLYPQVFICLAA